MRSENVSKRILTTYHIANILSPCRISWSLNTTVTADFRPEAEFTLFLRKRTK